MSKLHKLFKEMQTLSHEDLEMLNEALRQASNCRRMCEELGIRYTEKRCISWIKKHFNNNAVTSVPTPATPTNPLPKIEKIIRGDNLDIIEEAAEKKGLL
jgi:hypothetical protein